MPAAVVGAIPEFGVEYEGEHILEILAQSDPRRVGRSKSGESVVAVPIRMGGHSCVRIPVSIAGRALGWNSGGMTHSSGLHFKTYCMILVMVVFGPLGNTLLGKGMKNVGSAATWVPAQLPHLFLQTFTSGYVWLGVGSLLTFFVAYMLILSWADFSYVQPASSVSYLVVALLGYFYLGEQITALHWAGIVVICLGVFVVGNTPPRTTQVL